MPSAKILEAKKQMVAELAEKMKNAQSGILVNYCGVTVEKDTVLRKNLREAGVDYAVIKNTYIRKAAEIAGIEGLDASLEGMTAFAVSDDPVAPAKVLYNFAKENENFKLKVGFVDGKIIDEEGIKELASIPSKEGLVCKIMGSMMSPLYGLAFVLQAKIDKEGGVPAEE